MEWNQEKHQWRKSQKSKKKKQAEEDYIETEFADYLEEFDKYESP